MTLSLQPHLGQLYFLNAKSIDTLARGVGSRRLIGKRAERTQRLSAAGYDYAAVERRVNELLS